MSYRLVGIIALSVLLLSTALVQRAYGAFFDSYSLLYFPYPVSCACCPPCPLGRFPPPGGDERLPTVQFNYDPLFLPPDVARRLGYRVLPPPRAQTGDGGGLLFGAPRDGGYGGGTGRRDGGIEGRDGYGGYSRDGDRFGGGDGGRDGLDGQRRSRDGTGNGRDGFGRDGTDGGGGSDPCVSIFDLVPGLTGPRLRNDDTIFGPLPELFEKNCRQRNRRKSPQGGFF